MTTAATRLSAHAVRPRAPQSIEARLREVAGRCPDPALRPRVHRLLEAAAEAILLLQDLQLVPLGEELLTPEKPAELAASNKLLQLLEKYTGDV